MVDTILAKQFWCTDDRVYSQRRMVFQYSSYCLRCQGQIESCGVSRIASHIIEVEAAKKGFGRKGWQFVCLGSGPSFNSQLLRKTGNVVVSALALRTRWSVIL